MTLTRQHFTLIAAGLKASMPDASSPHALIHLDQWCHTVKTMADTLSTTNPAFNRQKFILACGLTQLTPSGRPL